MGALASSAVTVLQSWEQGTRQGSLLRVWKRLSLTLTGQGGESNTIDETTLGFASNSLKVAQAILFTDGSDQKRAVVAFTDGGIVYLTDTTASTDADRGEPQDLTGTLIIEVAGLPAPATS